MNFEKLIRLKDCSECPVREECEEAKARELQGEGEERTFLHVEIEKASGPLIAIKMQEERESFRKWVFAKAQEVGTSPFALTKGIILTLRAMSKVSSLVN